MESAKTPVTDKKAKLVTPQKAGDFSGLLSYAFQEFCFLVYNLVLFYFLFFNIISSFILLIQFFLNAVNKCYFSFTQF